MKTPCVFIGHGSPQNIIGNNEYTVAWKHIAEAFAKPKTILVISAHWFTRGTFVTSAERPPMIYDFYGFPEKLYEVVYPAPGNPDLADKIHTMLKDFDIKKDPHRGYDHGAWCVLSKMYPKADIPVVQLSIDMHKSPKEHFEMGRALALLKEENVLIIGSGNISHNLMMLNYGGAAYSWAVDFDEFIKNAVLQDDTDRIINYRDNKDSHYAVPTPEHFLPLLYILGAKSSGDKVSFYSELFDLGSLSMRCILFSEKNR